MGERQRTAVVEAVAASRPAEALGIRAPAETFEAVKEAWVSFAVQAPPQMRPFE